MVCESLGGYDVPARFWTPGDAVQLLLGEQVEGRREVGGIDDALLFGRQIAGEARDAAVRLHPDAAVGDVNVFEDVRLRELVLLALRRLGLIRTQGRDVDQGGDAWVHTGVGDDGAPVGVADKNDRTADAPECADGRVDITFQRVLAVLRSHHLV